MKLMKSLVTAFLILMIAGVLSPAVSSADDTLDGKWTLYTEVVRGTNKGLESETTINITQDLSNGRIDGKALEGDETQIGRVSGLVKGTFIEMTFSYEKRVLRCSLNLNHDGTFIGGIFRSLDGGEGVIYGIKEKKE
ncbi:MAG: hypothetical protein AB1454_03435 [Candidatus Auribacterota bacterium]